MKELKIEEIKTVKETIDFIKELHWLRKNVLSYEESIELREYEKELAKSLMSFLREKVLKKQVENPKE